MHDPLSTSENAAASQDRGGLSGRRGRIDSTRHCLPVRPALHAAGAYAFLEAHILRPASCADRAFRQSPTATTRAAPARPAGLRIVET